MLYENEAPPKSEWSAHVSVQSTDSIREDYRWLIAMRHKYKCLAGNDYIWHNDSGLTSAGAQEYIARDCKAYEEMEAQSLDLQARGLWEQVF